MAITPSIRALITLDEYKRFKDPSTPAAGQLTNNDEHFQFLINAVGDVFRTYCNLPLIVEDDTELRDGDGTSSALWLYRYPVVTGTGITFSATEDRGFGPVALTLGTDFKLRADTGELVRITGIQAYKWPEGIQNLSITYRAGRWASTAVVDPDMKLWACRATDWLNDMGPAIYGARLEGPNIVRPDDMPRPIKLGLQRYRRYARV